MGTTHTLEQYLRARYAETGETEFRLQLVGVSDKVRAYITPAGRIGQGADVTIAGNQVAVREVDTLGRPAKQRPADPRKVEPM